MTRPTYLHPGPQARLAGYFNNDSGYIDNSIGKDKRSDDTISVRAMLNVDFNDDTSLLLIGQHTDIDTRGGVFHSRASKIDASGESVFCSTGDTDCGTFTADVDQFSQEIRLNGKFGSMDWIVGAYYLNIDNLFTGAFAFPSDGYLPKFEGDSKTETVSAFGQVDYSLSDNLLFTVGARWTRDDRDFVYTMIECDVTSEYGDGFCPARLITDPERAASPYADNAGFGGLLVDGMPHAFNQKDSEFSGKVQLDWQVTDNHLVYAGVSRGVKGGGFNTPTDGFDVADIRYVGFDPEILTAYEVGAKTRWSDGRVRLNGSVAAQLSAYYSGKQYFNVVNAEVTEGGDYVIADASLTYYSPSEALEVSLFVHNFTDEEPLTYSYDITGFGNYTIQTFGPPRWVGGRVKYSF